MIPPDQEIFEIESRIATRRSQLARRSREAGSRALQALASPWALGAAALIGFLAAGGLSRREKRPPHPERRKEDHLKAAKATGMNEFRIAVRHVLPNTLAPLIVLATAQLGSTILTEASLSFLGLGVPEPHPSWGRMLSESAAEYVRTAPWLVIFPGVAISLIVFGTNLLGDAVRDMLDPRQRS